MKAQLLKRWLMVKALIRHVQERVAEALRGAESRSAGAREAAGGDRSVVWAHRRAMLSRLEAESSSQAQPREARS